MCFSSQSKHGLHNLFSDQKKKQKIEQKLMRGTNRKKHKRLNQLPYDAFEYYLIDVTEREEQRCENMMHMHLQRKKQTPRPLRITGNKNSREWKSNYIQFQVSLNFIFNQ